MEVLRLKTHSQVKTRLGVLVTKKAIQKIRKQKPPERIEMLRKANEIAELTLYFFSIKDISTNNKCIVGFYYDEKKRLWQRAQFPYPDVIYRRGSGDIKQKKEKRKLQLFLNQLHDQHTKFLNHPSGFNKWEVYQKLKNDPVIAPHLPETKKLETVKDIEKMLNKYTTIYIKASKGRRGKQVMKVTIRSKNEFQFRYFSTRVRSETVSDLYRLKQHLDSIFKREDLIVQEAISLIGKSDKIIDFRGEVQRNGNGELEVVAVPVRISQKNSPITTHAESCTLEKFLNENFAETKKELQQQIEKLLLKVYQAIEKDHQLLGELGIDVGLDKYGKLWLIECNAQSAKVSLMKAYDQKTIEKVFLNPLQYAKFLHRLSLE